MKKKPLSLAAIISSIFICISSMACILIQPDMSNIIPLWQIAIIIMVASIFFSALLYRNVPNNRIPWLAIDIAFELSMFVFIYIFQLNPDFIIQKPFGLSASFDIGIIMPMLLLATGIIGFKDSINILYHFSAKAQEIMVFSAIKLTAILALLALGGILFIIIYEGIWAINWEFLTTPHRRLGQSGGISTVIVGTFWMVLGAMIVSSPLGVGAAIFLNEYSKNARLNRILTIAISSLNGVPSVVFGLFGLAFLVTHFGVSLLSGSIILGLINIPTIILTNQEALKAVPNSLREGSMALGASKWQTIRRVVLPSAMPGILTGLIMGVAKASGETAPIMWIAVTFTATPVQMIHGIIPNIFQPVNNLDYHLLNLIYFLGAWDVWTKAWGTALVLIALVLGTNMLAVLVRNHYRKKISW
ncbi:MAG: phosphate ABC transporter permease PstA [Methanotrichaceae archaeon]|nr:phosphate ABC transporter permease PstA [Methanotrichaceae archaeon]